MRFSIEEIADLLDETIQKGLKKKSKIDQIEEDICKGLTFNPYIPHEMTDESPYYNPYFRTVDCGYAPFPTEYWLDRKGESEHFRHNYATNTEFWNTFKEPAPMMNKFRGFQKSVEDFIVKGGPVPVGTVHTFKDGQNYKKMAEGNWQVVAGREERRHGDFLNDKRPEVKQQANQMVEQHAAKTMAIKEAMKKKEAEAKTIDQAKKEAMQAAAKHVHGAMKTVYEAHGSKMPKELKEHTKQALKEYATPKPKDPKQHVQEMGQALQPKTHNVSVKFSHQGKEYSHHFPNVAAEHHTEAVEKVRQALKQKLPGASISKVHVESRKPMNTRAAEM